MAVDNIKVSPRVLSSEEKQARARAFERKTEGKRKFKQAWDRNRFVQAGRVLKQDVSKAGAHIRRSWNAQEGPRFETQNQFKAGRGKAITAGAKRLVESFSQIGSQYDSQPQEIKNQLKLEKQRQNFALRMAQLRARQGRQVNRRAYINSRPSSSELSPIDYEREGFGQEEQELQQLQSQISQEQNEYAKLKRLSVFLKPEEYNAPFSYQMRVSSLRKRIFQEYYRKKHGILSTPYIFGSRPQAPQAQQNMKGKFVNLDHTQTYKPGFNTPQTKLNFWKSDALAQPTILNAQNVFSVLNSKKFNMRW